jgi:hypothetical protein
MYYAVIAKSKSGRRIQVGRLYESSKAAHDLAELVRKEKNCEVHVESRAPARRASPPEAQRTLSDLLDDDDVE